MTAFSEKLKSERTAFGLTRADVAKLTGLSIYTIGSYELGMRTPRKSSKLKLARVFDIFELTDEERNEARKAASDNRLPRWGSLKLKKVGCGGV